MSAWREDAHRTLDKMLDAIEQDRAANSNDARAKTEPAALLARDELIRISGIERIERRRMVVDALGLPLGAAPLEAENFERLLRNCWNDFLEIGEGEKRLRLLLARAQLDNKQTLSAGADILAGHLLQNAEGRYGPLDSPLDFLDHVAAVAGRDQREGFADETREAVVVMTGYTVGLEIGATGRIPDEIWQRAKRAHRERAHSGEILMFKIAPASAATIKDWCLKKGQLAALFQDARLEAAAWTAPDPSKTLKSMKDSS